MPNVLMKIILSKGTCMDIVHVDNQVIAGTTPCHIMMLCIPYCPDHVA